MGAHSSCCIPTFLQVIYFLYRIVWHFGSLTSWTLAGYTFLLGSTYLSYSWVVGAAEEGGSSEYVHCSHRLVIDSLVASRLTRRLHFVDRYAMDVLIITLFVQAGLCVSDYFWLVYLVVRPPLPLLLLLRS